MQVCLLASKESFLRAVVFSLLFFLTNNINMNDCHALVLVLLLVCAYNYVDVCVCNGTLNVHVTSV